MLDLVDGPTELMPILKQIALASVEPAGWGDSPLDGVGLTIGVLADTLCACPETVRTASLVDRSQVRFGLLGCLHVAAHASATAPAASEQEPDQARALRDPADVTDAAAHVPPRPLHGELSRLSVGPEPGSFSETVWLWSTAAKGVLGSRTQATKYAFQRTAASIAHLCWTAARDATSEPANDPEALELRVALTEAFQSWQRAADWPPELRLDGRSGDLRKHSHDLQMAISIGPSGSRGGFSTDELASVLFTAIDVGAVYEAALRRCVLTGGLWILAEALGASYLARHPGTHRSDWLPDSGSRFGAVLVQNATQANLDLRRAIGLLQVLEPDRVAEHAPHGVCERVVHLGAVRFDRAPTRTRPTRAIGP